MSLKITKMTDEDLEKMMEEHRVLNPDLKVREDVKQSLHLWATAGIYPGGFLTAVLENNLMEAMARADSYNRASIHQICSYVYNELPAHSHGSPEIVKAWNLGFAYEE